jgi:hypothetical protein
MLRWIAVAPLIGCGVSVAVADTYKVRNNWDSGTYSLRWAIEQANSHAGADTIEFAPRMMGQVIKPMTPLPDLWDSPTYVDADINDDGKPDVALNGSRLSSGWGLRWLADGSSLEGLAIAGFPDGGIYFEDADQNTIRSCHIGVNLAGTKAIRNHGPDLDLATSYQNTIGGPTAQERNVIAGGYRDPSFPTFADAGILAHNCDGNKIIGNYFGLAADGLTPLEGGNVGIAIAGGGPHSIGGTAAGEGNVLGNLWYGIWLADTTGNQIAGNLLGLAADGSTLARIGFSCIEIRERCTGNVIGGTAPGSRNVFAGDAHEGVHFNQILTENNQVKGNYFGLNAAGTRPRLLSTGIRIASGAGAQIIGGRTERAGNYFAQRTRASNWTYGINVTLGSGAHSVIRRNKFGLRPDGGKSPIAEGIRVTGVDLQILENTFDGMKQAAVMATEAGAYPRIFRNTFRDCYAAVNILSGAGGLLGNLGNSKTDDDGGNIFDLANTRNIWNITPNRIRAEGNWFGTTSRAAINAKILDRNDDPSLGKVDFLPLGAAPAAAGAATLSLAGTAATPTPAGGAEIVFSLSASANVTVEVLNIAGRRVAIVARDVACGAGLQRMAWSGQTVGGTAVPSGTYLLRVTARDAEGGQASGLTSLRVLR